MNILPPIHLAASCDELRPSMTYIKISDGVATATDANIIAMLNLFVFSELDNETIDKLDGCFIHKDVWIILQKADAIKVESGNIVYLKGNIKALYPIEKDVSYPDTDWIINEYKKIETKSLSAIAVNPNFISIAGKILSSHIAGNGVLIKIKTHDKMILITTQDEERGFVGIMPMLLNNGVEPSSEFNFDIKNKKK